MRLVPTILLTNFLFSFSAQAWEASTEVGWGAWLPRSTVEKFYGQANRGFYILGIAASTRWIGLRLDTGFFRETSALHGVDSGRKSGEHQTLWVLDFTPAVEFSCCRDFVMSPFVRVGHAFQIYSVEDPYDQVRGLKQASSFTGGLRILLDRALSSSDPFDLFGLNHVYLNMSVRYVHPWSSGLDLGGWVLSPMLGADF